MKDLSIDKKKGAAKNIEFEKRYLQLNPKQREAVDTIDGPVLVVAGPGTGKTELLSIRAANILKKTDTLPNSILLLTFTESAAYNMRERLINLIGETAYRIGVYTFHSFATDILNKYPEHFFDGAKFHPATEIDQIGIIENIVKALPRKNPLSKFHPELGYIYIKDIINSIRDLKKGGYTAESYFEKLKTNKKNLKELNNLCAGLEEIAGKRKYTDITIYYVNIYKKLEVLTDNEIAQILLSTLKLAIKNADDEQSSKPLTAWKNAYTKKQENNIIILKDCDPDKQEKQEALYFVYCEYEKALYKNCLFDFEDMILLAGKALKENLNLRADLQEKFQYIMIDEYQDTNDAQFNLVKYLLDNGYENNPNVLAVGDDDQAIFKFQGAELNNIFNFTKTWGSTKVIVLDKNYRSTQKVLDFARVVIIKGEDRLEIRDKNILKVLSGENQKLLPGEIIIENFENEFLEYEWVAKKIGEIIRVGVDPKEIAIICRKHAQLKQVTEILNIYKIPYSYEKRENVLDKKPIAEIVTILKYLNQENTSSGEDLLPEILSFNFWGIERIEIWKIAEAVKSWKEISWIEAMQNSENKKIQEIAIFLINLSVDSLSTPLEYLIDKIVGTTEYLFSDNEYEDNVEELVKSDAQLYTSPYKKYYFNKDNFDHNKTEYLDFLMSLRTFVGALREFHQGKILLAKDINEFLEIYNGHNLTLSLVSPFATSNNAVSVLTAHKSKGLEFEYVFLLSASQDIWKKSGFPNKIPFPINMPLTVEGENDDDKIRLLYVAITRAKHSLFITHTGHRLEYLEQGLTPALCCAPSVPLSKREGVSASQEILEAFSLTPQKVYLEDEKILLKRLLENYKMPVTHLNNFLNFTKVGPEKFIEQNLLRFPQAYSPSAAYGSAMHATIEAVYLHFNKHGIILPQKQIEEIYKNNLERYRLPKHDFKKYLDSGIESLEIYIKYLNERKILPNTKVEVKFASENVMIGQVPATGNIDRVETIGNELIVTDLKTGESINAWENEKTGLSDYEKIKLHFFKYQLAYYALLIENSRTYSHYKIKVGNIEFVEADNNKIVVLPFEINQEIKDRVKLLTDIVYKKIQNLNFPNTDNYPQNYKGILQFEEDLLNLK